jgi:hypothetical protein
VAGPLHVVDPLPPGAPLPYGLLEAAQVPPDGDAHWQAGVIFQSPCVSGSTTYDECIVVTGSGGPPAEPNAKAVSVDLDVRGAQPFTVYAEYECSPVGMDAELAERALSQSQGWQVERAFWTGLADGQAVVFPHLAADTAVVYQQGSTSVLLQSPVVTGGGPYDAAEGLGVLEAALADCLRGSAGVIHVPQLALPSFVANGLVKAQGARLVTLAGNTVVAGSGYPGSGPDGEDPASGTSWVYGTGPVFAYRGPVRSIRRPQDALDRANNTLSAIAERTFLVGFGCCHIGVLLQLGAPTGSGDESGGGGIVASATTTGGY